MEVRKSARFEQEARELLGADRQRILDVLEWAVRGSALVGQQVRETDFRVWPLYLDDGYVYIAYYLIEGDVVLLETLIKRIVPISPRVLGLED